MSPGSLFEGSRENTLRNSGAVLSITGKIYIGVQYRTAQHSAVHIHDPHRNSGPGLKLRTV